MVNIAPLVVLHELMNLDDEKPHRGKTRKWVKWRSERGYFNIIKELRIENRAGFRKMLKMDVRISRSSRLKFLIQFHPKKDLVGPVQLNAMKDFHWLYAIWRQVNLSNLRAFNTESRLRILRYYILTKVAVKLLLSKWQQLL